MENIEIKDLFNESFAAFENSMNGDINSSIHSLRKKSLEKFNTLEFPAAKDEEWKHTNIKPVVSKKYITVSDSVDLKKDDIQKYLYDEDIYSTLVFVDGKFNNNLSDLSKTEHNISIQNLGKLLSAPDDFLLKHLQQSIEKSCDIFSVLNSAFISDGTAIILENNQMLDNPIQILYITASDKEIITNPRNIFILGKNSSIKLIETYAALNDVPYFTNCVTEVFLSDNSYLEHVKLQDEALSSFHISTTNVFQSRDSRFSSYNINFGGSIIRNNINVNLDGIGTETILNGLSLGQGSQHTDNHTLINHNQPRCNSHEIYKSILTDKARGVFNGKIFVKPDAQKTNAIQENKSLLLSDDAVIYTKPQLEIFADDVKCTHGAAIGQLDKDALFYLKSRGFGEQEAKATLIYAFASDAIHSISLPFVRDRLEETLSNKLKD